MDFNFILKTERFEESWETKRKFLEKKRVGPACGGCSWKRDILQSAAFILRLFL
jgi:hypothetical protein